jgi:hypothetical protein
MIDGSLISCTTCKDNFSTILAERGFLNITTDCYINLGMVKKVDKTGRGSVTMENGRQLNLDLISKEELIEHITKYNALN